MSALLAKIRKCGACSEHLPLGPRPVLQFSTQSRILIVGQAPGLAVHNSGVPWDDKSGERLRAWLGVTPEIFYDPKLVAIVPMGFCYPGRGGGGDLPPRKECAPLWMPKILKELRRVELTILIGQYALQYFLADQKAATLTETVRNWKAYAPDYLVLPHPSPRNNIWLKKNPWFEKSVVPDLRKRVHSLL